MAEGITAFNATLVTSYCDILILNCSGTKEIHVTTADEAYKVLTIGRQNLQMADTKLNHNSSRR